MVDQSYGLRFDIYERIHLGDDVIGIDELEEIELYPKVQVIPGEEYASLRGHLLLTGVYRGGGESQQLEHYIPVEITIPLSRVNDLEEIAVEIENFDVDLLNSRSLNVTGVLLLQGIETNVSSTGEEWRDQEFTAEHELPHSEQREPYPGVEEANSIPYAADEQQGAWVPEQLSTVSGQTFDVNADEIKPLESLEASSFPVAEVVAEPIPVAESHISSYQPAETSEQLTWNDALMSSGDKSEEAQEVAVEAPIEAVSAWTEDSFSPPEEELPVAQLLDASQLEEGQEATLSSTEHQEHEDKPEMKIALGSKKSNDQNGLSSFSISNLLPKHRHIVENNEVEQEEVEVELVAEEEDIGNRPSWKNLFIRQEAEEQAPFRKMKLVIVQREETLNEIAERYHLSSRELQLYNRLEEQNLAEGQVLYIP
ncbi:stage VI sporulation protein D [Paenibacillus turicensis]|uniref:Stage VI sporulation protein D n=1 Tax=Paenibacillus turicensis TaxID=160487 RepID=A0ABS4FR06_9BACL|nr:LysM peptidoglycan-binding domain-containing protein [Paenibacillus turicensis]MBP1905019.1 stage VI sporulation protein D [Paenibacillus turicensis]